MSSQPQLAGNGGGGGGGLAWWLAQLDPPPTPHTDPHCDQISPAKGRPPDNATILALECNLSLKSEEMSGLPQGCSTLNRHTISATTCQGCGRRSVDRSPLPPPPPPPPPIGPPTLSNGSQITTLPLALAAA